MHAVSWSTVGIASINCRRTYDARRGRRSTSSRSWNASPTSWNEHMRHRLKPAPVWRRPRRRRPIMPSNWRRCVNATRRTKWSYANCRTRTPLAVRLGVSRRRTSGCVRNWTRRSWNWRRYAANRSTSPSPLRNTKTNTRRLRTRYKTWSPNCTKQVCNWSCPRGGGQAAGQSGQAA